MEEEKKITETETAEEIKETETVQTENGEIEAPEKPQKPPLKKRVLKEIKEWVVSLVIALAIVLVLRGFLFTIIRVDGDSMNPTLIDRERLFVTVYDVKFGEVKRNDVVICNYPGRVTEHIFGIKTKTLFVKRVVGVPGDTITRTDCATYVTNGETGETVTLDAKYAQRYPGYDYEYTLKDDEYFVVGDNRGNSHDSRNWNDGYASDDVGPITGDMIKGHVRSVFWPLKNIRTVGEFEYTE